MNRALAAIAVVSTLLSAACATQPPAAARSDQFPMAKGAYPVKAIAVLPGGGALADAIGEELARRGFVVSTAAATESMVDGVDWKAVSTLYIPGRGNSADVEKLTAQLRARGVDAFLVLKADGFAPRQWRQYPYWQTVDTHLYRTRAELGGNAHSYWGWVNIDNKGAKSAREAAAEIVARMATFVSNPL